MRTTKIEYFHTHNSRLKCSCHVNPPASCNMPRWCAVSSIYEDKATTSSDERTRRPHPIHPPSDTFLKWWVSKNVVRRGYQRQSWRKYYSGRCARRGNPGCWASVPAIDTARRLENANNLACIFCSTASGSISSCQNSHGLLTWRWSIFPVHPFCDDFE